MTGLITRAMLLALVLLSPVTFAEAILQVLPTRVVLEKQRWMSVTLVNHGDEEASYRLFLRNIRANENGTFVEVTEDDEPLEGELFADKMIRFSPRRVTVPPHSKQQVRVVLRKPKDLMAGEYRSHLVFRSLPKQISVLDSSDGDKQVDLSIKPIVEVTIPVIVRHGEMNATMDVDDVNLIEDPDEGQLVEVSINRQGNRSLYGDIDVWWTKNGKVERVSYARGVAVYVPNQHRKIILSIELEDTRVQGGELRAVFTEDPAYGGDLVSEITKSI